MKLTPPQSTTNAPASEIISRVGDAGNQFFLEVWGVAELYLVDVGDVESNALGVGRVVEEDGDDGLSLFHRITQFTNDIDGIIGIDRRNEDNGL